MKKLMKSLVITCMFCMMTVLGVGQNVIVAEVDTITVIDSAASISINSQ